MAAYIDESVGNRVSIALAMPTMGVGRAHSAVKSSYERFLRTFGLSLEPGELKFSSVLLSLRRHGIALSGELVESMLALPGLRSLSESGCIYRALVVRNLDALEAMRPVEFRTLRRCKVPARDARIFLAMLTLFRGLKVRKLVVDKGLLYSASSVKRSLGVLSIPIEVSFADSSAEAGLQVADFVAGAARYLRRFRFATLVEGKSFVISEV